MHSNLGTRWRCKSASDSRHFYLQGKIPQYPLDKRLVVPQSQSKCGGKEKKSLSPAGSETQSSSLKPVTLLGHTNSYNMVKMKINEPSFYFTLVLEVSLNGGFCKSIHYSYFHLVILCSQFHTNSEYLTHSNSKHTSTHHKHLFLTAQSSELCK